MRTPALRSVGLQAFLEGMADVSSGSRLCFGSLDLSRASPTEPAGSTSASAGGPSTAENLGCKGVRS